MSQAQTYSQSRPDHFQTAIDLLIDDHDQVKKLFKDYAQLKEQDSHKNEKAELVKKICKELKVHTQIEEEIFYPAVEKAINQQDLMDEANVEHLGAKNLILELESMEPTDHYYDAKVKVLSEYIEHHIEEEQTKMFPKAKKTAANNEQVAEDLKVRKQELQNAF